MELVYLWVEDYKNIKKQGFNFSPRFSCKFYDEYEEDENGKEKLKENCKLEIKPKEHIENFFGDNINVTAIVGKNGSGKSSVLEILNSLTNNQSISSLDCKYIIILDNGLYQTNINLLSNSFLQKYIKYKDIYTLNYVSETSSEEKKLERNIDISIKKIVKLLKTLHKFKIDIDDSDIFMYKPKFIHLIILSSKELVIKVKAKFIKGIEDNTCEFDRINNFFNKIDKYDEKWKQFILHKILINEFSFLENLKIFTLYECIVKYCYDDSESDLQFEYQKFINNTDRLSKISFKDTTEEQWEFLLSYGDIFIYDFSDEYGRKYTDLSHGEKIIFSIFLHLTRIFDDYIGRNDCLVLFDEIDIPLHPNWQKSLIQSFLNTYVNKKNNIHFILTTHSPFLLSDIPKQNIIFLDKDEKGNCKVVDGLKDKKQTFGANIHTLLSDSFFMEDGLMGEFAKGKIDKAITLLNQDKLNEKDLKYCEQIISIIGEPIVKNQLEKMLHYKKVDYLAKDTREEIEFLKHRIDLLSKR